MKPDIVKSEIIKVGSFDENGAPIGWSFYSTHPKSVGVYVGATYNLYGGHTLEELQDIYRDTL